MSKKQVKLIATLLSLAMLVGVLLTGCGGDEVPETSPQGSSQSETENHESTVPGDDTGSDTAGTETTGSEGESTEETEEIVGPTLGVSNGDLIEYAASLKDGVNSYYADAIRSSAVVENQNMTLIHGLNGGAGSSDVQNLVNSISNKEGGLYIENTMDAFVKTTAGETYYASDWMTGSSFNILRGGVYYQDVRISDQGFADSEALLADAHTVDLNRFVATGADVTSHGVNDGIYSFTVNSLADPGVVNKRANFDSADYNALLLTVKTEESITGQLFVRTDSMSNFTSEMSKYFSIIPGDDFHTYVIRLDDMDGYQGKIEELRFDIGSAKGEQIYIESLKAVNLKEYVVPVRFERKLHTYADKLHQELHFVTTAETGKVASYGMMTEIAADTVAKLVIKDGRGEHTSLDKIHWNSVEYVGFDIKGVGVFGYILADYEGSGKLTVTLEDGIYKITQEMAVEGKIKNKTHFYMGHRIYTDAGHSFDAFLKEAEIERNPLAKENFKVRYIKEDPTMYSIYLGYEPLRGAYGIKMNHTDFNRAYYKHWNQHFRAYTTVVGDELDRNIYLYTYTTGDQLECATLLDDKDMVLPVQLQVIKNFTNDGEESIFVRDEGYSEVYLPLQVKAGSTRSFSVLNMYQNWGNYPLKQLSWIQYSSPYYHLSTGVTETNCIEPMYGGNAFQFVNDVDNGVVYEFHVTSGKSLHTLPDFRPMSQEFWGEQPQHYSAANITWLEYTDKDGNYSASDFRDDRIDSFGPVYADITMDYISDDGKIAGQTRHVEMPQTDENRTYYTLKYDVLESISFDNFTENFTLIEINSRWGSVIFKKMGYLDENNNCTVQKTNLTSTGRYTKLGKEAPYFSLYDNGISNAPTNYALIVKSIDAKIGGVSYDGNLMVEDWVENDMVYTRLTLDAGEVTLLPGDYIHIDMILLPWGDVNSPDDSNVRQVRQDSCLKPFVAEPAVGSVVEDSFIPGVKAENNVAEFSFSGGHNNGVVRVYGFDVLTRPIVSELIDGEWVKLDLSSKEHPDEAGNAHYYDGYVAYYDGEGSFSYAFVIDTEQGAARQFRVTAEDFAEYPEVETGEGDGVYIETESEEETAPIEEETDPIGENAPVLYYSAQDIHLAAKETVGKGNLNKTVLKLDEDGTKYVRLSAQAGAQEAMITLTAQPDALKAAKYLSIKYRTVTPGGYHESWLDSRAMAPQGSVKNGYVTDGEWQYYVVDAANAVANGNFNGNELVYYRFDFMNVDAGIGLDAYVDIAYIGLFNSENEAMYFGLGDAYKTPEEQKAELEATYIDPASGFSGSDKTYGSTLDFINGKAVVNAGGNSKYGASVIEWDSVTMDNCGLVFAGWAVADGGIAKYVWSADNGKTWFAIDPHIIEGVGSGAGDAHYYVVSLKIGPSSFSAGSNKNSIFQHNDGGGLMANLAAYEGQTVDVIFAAIPEKDQQALCLLAVVKGVEVIGETDKTPEKVEVELPEEETLPTDSPLPEAGFVNPDTLIKPESGYQESQVVYGCSLDWVNGQSPAVVAGGNSYDGAPVVAFHGTTLDNCGLVFAGWAVADGGIAKYVWSADYGKTWYEIDFHKFPGLGNGAGEAHYGVVSRRIGYHNFSEGSNLNSIFQNNDGGGLMANLVNYEGRTVDVIFAAVPNTDLDGLCVLAVVKGVKVVGATDATPAPDEKLTPDDIKPLEKVYKDPATLIDASSEYKASTLAYGCSLDMINGYGERGKKTPTLFNAGGNSKDGCAIYDHNVNTIRGPLLVFSGWSVVDGGIKDYVYSTDGGKTWSIVLGEPGSGAGDAHYGVVQNAIGPHSFSEGSNLKSIYQSGVGLGENVGGLTINLQQYAGQTIQVLFGAVPVNASDTVCLIACVNNVHVSN